MPYPLLTTKVQINYHTTNCDSYSKLRRLNKVLYSAFINISMQVNFIVILKQAFTTSHFLSLTNLDQLSDSPSKSFDIYGYSCQQSVCCLSRTASDLICLSKFPPLSLTNQMPENKNTYQLNKTYMSLQNVICLVWFVKLNAWKLKLKLNLEEDGFRGHEKWKYFVCFVWYLYADNAFRA